MKEMRQQVTDTRVVDPPFIWLHRAGAAAALLTGLSLFLAGLSLSSGLLQPGSPSGAFSIFQDNWLIIIFKLHAGFSGIQIGRLHVFNFLDVAILALVGIMCLGLYAALRGTSRIWSLVAAIQPFLGIVLFVATKTTGRSAVMGAVLVISLVMLRDKAFSRALAFAGIAASVFLLIGDFTAGIPPSASVATLFGIAYVLFIAWFFLIARSLLHIGGAS